MNEDSKTSTKALYLRLLSYLRPHLVPFGLAVLGMIAIAATEPVFPALMKHLLDHGFKTGDAKMVWLIPAGIVALFLVRGVLTFCVNYLMLWIASQLTMNLRQEMFAKLLVLPVATFHQQSAGKLISKMVYDVGTVTDAATTVLVTIVRESFTALVLLAYLLYLDWKLTLVTMLLGPVIALLVRAFSARARSASRLTMAAIMGVTHTVEETVNAHKVVKIFSGQHQQSVRYAGNLAALRRAMMREAIPASAITPITHIAASVAVAVITFLALNQSADGSGTTPGSFISFITAMLMLISPIKQLTAVNSTLQRGLAGCESVFGLLDTPGEEDRGQLELHDTHGRIKFDNVSFAYPDTERLALDSVSFEIDKGQTVALVGSSGGGKSTIGALIPRFYTPGSGHILIDGINISDVKLASLRQSIALVSQDIVLFNDTIAANISFGCDGPIDRQRVVAAAQSANAWAFIQELPEGLDTLIGENGAKLSGGQRQRIAIARAMLKNAPILILDEATSALDSESERQVQSALGTLMRGKTTLVIAHRLSTIENADRILVLDQGKIAESGTHAELVAASGIYANLTRIQA